MATLTVGYDYQARLNAPPPTDKAPIRKHFSDILYWIALGLLTMRPPPGDEMSQTVIATLNHLSHCSGAIPQRSVGNPARALPFEGKRSLAMRLIGLGVVAVAALALTACGQTVEQRAATGAIAGAVVAGPVGAAVGGAAGAAVGQADRPKH